MRTTSPPKVYLLEIEAIADFPWRPIPPVERLKRFVKAADRSYGFRVRVVKPKPTVEVVFRATEDQEDVA